MFGTAALEFLPREQFRFLPGDFPPLGALQQIRQNNQHELVAKHGYTGGPHSLDHGALKISATFAACCHLYLYLSVVHSAFQYPFEKRERAARSTARPPSPFS